MVIQGTSLKGVNELQKRHIILFHGFPVCYKSTLAIHLEKKSGIPLCATFMYGKVMVDGKWKSSAREVRYVCLLKNAEEYLKTGVSVILDGNFSLKTMREKIYRLADKYDYEIIILKTVCYDENIILRRLEERKENKSLIESDVNRFEIFKKLKNESERKPVEKDKYVIRNKCDIILTDTGKKVILINNPEKKEKTDLIVKLLSEKLNSLP